MSAEKVAAALKGVSILLVGVAYEADFELSRNTPSTLVLKMYITDASLDELRRHVLEGKKLIIVSGE